VPVARRQGLAGVPAALLAQVARPRVVRRSLAPVHLRWSRPARAARMLLFIGGISCRWHARDDSGFVRLTQSILHTGRWPRLLPVSLSVCLSSPVLQRSLAIIFPETEEPRLRRTRTKLAHVHHASPDGTEHGLTRAHDSTQPAASGTQKRPGNNTSLFYFILFKKRISRDKERHGCVTNSPLSLIYYSNPTHHPTNSRETRAENLIPAPPVRPTTTCLTINPVPCVPWTHPPLLIQ
jgi:hypothetical protein